MRHAPQFWQGDSVLSYILQPLALLYQLISRLHRSRQQTEILPVPVLCVGNLVTGGAGKTPLVLWLLGYFRSQGIETHVLSRGYGGKATEPVRVDADMHHFRQAGDEPLLIAQAGPCWVGQDRVHTARAATEAGAELLIMDDGLQNPALQKYFSFLVIDGGYGFGNAHLLPAGPLRESVADGMAKADAIVMMGEDHHQSLQQVPANKPVLHASLQPTEDYAELRGKRVVAFAGIGRPQKFFDTVYALGANIMACYAFADHHPYRDADAEMLLKAAHHQNATLVTTAKDAVRLPPALREATQVINVTLAWQDMPTVEKGLQEIIEYVKTGDIAASMEQEEVIVS